MIFQTGAAQHSRLATVLRVPGRLRSDEHIKTVSNLIFVPFYFPKSQIIDLMQCLLVEYYTAIQNELLVAVGRVGYAISNWLFFDCRLKRYYVVTLHLKTIQIISKISWLKFVSFRGENIESIVSTVCQAASATMISNSIQIHIGFQIQISGCSINPHDLMKLGS